MRGLSRFSHRDVLQVGHDAPVRVVEKVRPWSSVRTKVVAGTVVLLLLALVATVLVTRQMLVARVDQDVEQELAQEVEELRNLAAGTDPETGEPFADDVGAIFSSFMNRNVPALDEAFYSFVDGRPYLRSFDAPTGVLDDPELVDLWGSASEPIRRDVETSDGPARTLAVPLLDSTGTERGTFVVAVYPEEDLAAVDDVVRTITLVSLIVLAVSSVGAWLVVGRLLRPVEGLTEAARTIDAGDLARRIEVRGNDELAVLATTFNSMLDRLDGAFASQRSFLDDVAHELRTPITIARGHLEVMAFDDGAPDPETVDVVTDELDRMSRYVDDLLLVARAARPDFLQLGVVDVGDLVDDVLARAVALGDRAWIRGPSPAPGEVLVVGDEGRLSQAVLALVTNAVQHTEPGGRIEIGAVVTDGRVRLSVSDDGPGLAPEDQTVIFDRFSRAATSRESRPEGTGLGLPIVGAIARAHRGSVSVESTLGEGATFHLDLPRHDASEDDT